MSLRTSSARWFEVLTLPELIPQAVERLARTGSVELESPGVGAPAVALPDLRERMAEYRRVAERYENYWPEPEFVTETEPESVAATLDRALATLSAWAEAADRHVNATEGIRRDREEFRLLQSFLESLEEGSALDLERVARAGPSLAGTLLVLPADAEVPAMARDVLVQTVATSRHRYLLLLGEPATIETLRERLGGRRARAIDIPAWLSGTPGVALATLTDRIAELDERERSHQQAIADLSREHGVSQALGEVRRLEWLVERMPNVPMSQHFAWVTGWTDDWQGTTLPPALSDYPALIDFPKPPPDKEAPLLLHNPKWARPFELFARLIGTPGRNEADPSMALALVVPLMFGYMFGDVGQGLVLMAAGWLLRHRVPPLRLLIPGGAAAAVFGGLFGSVFSLEHLLPALWVHPMTHPLVVLAVPIAFGAGLLLFSMGLEGLQEAWLGRFRNWLAVDAGLVAMYIGILATFWATAGLWLALLGLGWFLAGANWARRDQGWLAPASAFGELAERGLRLLVNTLSFARVGAFSLAHAGLSQAVTTLASAAGFGLMGGLVLALGNAVIIALEGLVVSVQTTRLVLFEFFVRFLHGGGRRFEPISPPAARALVEGQGENHAAMETRAGPNGISASTPGAAG
ncbi:hypothetical protein [Thiohalorhabdus sp.]|uniref:hypothetical protein n=1 Tax=Thiohalorhabdus sp. TaxID=3094134 RepID=UPI002FC3A12F